MQTNVKDNSNTKSKMSSKIKIAIVDDHEIFRSGIQMILSQNKEWEVVIEAVNGKDFLNQMEYIVPDIVLMDISMPDLNGYDATILALQKHPNLKVIILSMHSEEQYYLKMIEAGVKGFILKNSGVDELHHCINEVANGNNYFAQDLLKRIVLSINNKEIDGKIKLNDREKEVLQLICNGFTNKEISEIICLGYKSIERYRNILIQKTGVRNTAHLVMFAIKNKLVNI